MSINKTFPSFLVTLAVMYSFTGSQYTYSITVNLVEMNILLTDYRTDTSQLTIRYSNINFQVSDHIKKGKKKERNVLFYDALNSFYLWLYGI